MFPLPNTDSALIGPLFILFCALKATLQKKPIRDRKFPTREHRLLLDQTVPILKNVDHYPKLFSLSQGQDG